MSGNGAQADNRVVITQDDLARTQQEVTASPALSNPPTNIRFSAKVASSLLVLCLPVLCAFTAVTALRRHRVPELRTAWLLWLNTLLTISGIITSIWWAGFLVVEFRASPEPLALQPTLGLVSHDSIRNFPVLPAAGPLTAVELADKAAPLVFIVLSGRAGLPGSGVAIGAATLLMADDTGYLLGTNKHVVEAESERWLSGSPPLQVVSKGGSYASAAVVGTHQKLDLALLWIRRRSGSARYRQPIASQATLHVGESVFVIGHPQGLFFTLSTGLVSRVDGAGMLQISAPISPGNSGGPTWDNVGNLLGIVTYTFDKGRNPNAENLNFSTRADAFLTESGWKFRDDGDQILRKFIQFRPGA